MTPLFNDEKRDSLVCSMVSQSRCTLNMSPCLCTVHPIKYQSVSFSDVYIGEFHTLCPTLRHVHSKLHTTKPELIALNPGTKPSPFSVLDYFIEDNSCHYKRWRLDVVTNRSVKTENQEKPSFQTPDIRWFTTPDSTTRDNTQDNQGFYPSSLLQKWLQFWV
jgi:hypothetical protein